MDMFLDTILRMFARGAGRHKHVGGVYMQCQPRSSNLSIPQKKIHQLGFTRDSGAHNLQKKKQKKKNP
jgi:hypothetical protein